MYKIPANTRLIGKNLIFVPECHSTSSLLMEMSQHAHLAEGTLLITNTQTSGRGQWGNTWEAEAGLNFTFSVLVHPTFLLARNQFVLNMAISLGVADYLSQRLHKDVQIKWPNDIMVSNRKIAGILIENILSAEHIQQSIIGIGLNVNQQVFSIASATSMKIESSCNFSLSDELEYLLKNIEQRYEQLQKKESNVLRTDYLNRLYWKNEIHSFAIEGKTYSGQIRDIDTYGRLIVEIDQQLSVFGLKEIVFVK